MTEERWQQLIEGISRRMTVLERSTQALPEGVGTSETVVVREPSGRTLKIERIQKKRVIGERAVGSKRIGGDVIIEKQYADDERVDFVKVYEQAASGVWVELRPEALGL